MVKIICKVCKIEVNAKSIRKEYCDGCFKKHRNAGQRQYHANKVAEKPIKQKIVIVKSSIIPKRTCIECHIEATKEDKWRKYCTNCSNGTGRDRCKTYKEKHREAIKNYNKKYKKEHESELREQRKQYNIANRAIIREKVRGYRKKYHTKYPQAHLFATHRGRVNNILKSKRQQFAGSKELIGCSKQMLQSWIEFQFNSDQTFDNYGKVWHLDHCIPCTKFDTKKPEDISKCFHWSNLQPMNANKNLSKNNKTSLIEQLMQELKVHVFLKQNKKYKNYTMITYDRSLYV